ncbi:ADP-ribosylglycohydrolase family protein [Chondrinema litorale]|uniref:ADP-ribosylglycohydrolase family protein n=1 Tax=Chondrinema litorale TaxID=2994555 RepID=UPI0025431DB5|nr:ADP-ribosylglycohydrolase family protein [Chondrinema litorale]UZR93471.1 ADP-ribosylglycohydrolase family protein [Chondrinema litorale]
MILEGAIGDAYGAGFEFAERAVIEKFNHLERYIQHPKHTDIYKKYTDDTQMSIALVELMIEGSEWTPLNIANKFVECFKRDPRKGYATRFYNFLLEIDNGQNLLNKIVNKSERNGAAMRAYPVGLYKNLNDVITKAEAQAVITHATDKAIISAQAIAVISHYFIYQLGEVSELHNFLNDTLSFEWKGKWTSKVDIDAYQTVEAVLQILLNGKNLSQMLIDSVNLGGDVDTVASLVLAIASTSDYYQNDLPNFLYEDLENETYGRDYIQKLDKDLEIFLTKQQAI